MLGLKGYEPLGTLAISEEADEQEAKKENCKTLVRHDRQMSLVPFDEEAVHKGAKLLEFHAVMRTTGYFKTQEVGHVKLAKQWLTLFSKGPLATVEEIAEATET